MKLFEITYKGIKNAPIGYFIDPTGLMLADDALRYWWGTQKTVEYDFGAYAVRQLHNITILS